MRNTRIKGARSRSYFVLHHKLFLFSTNFLFFGAQSCPAMRDEGRGVMFVIPAPVPATQDTDTG